MHLDSQKAGFHFRPRLRDSSASKYYLWIRADNVDYKSHRLYLMLVDTYTWMG
ncbi:MAG: hypothetical protein ACI96P_001660, partial [Candidatus Azotimanducaceae bacterium]